MAHVLLKLLLGIKEMVDPTLLYLHLGTINFFFSNIS